MTIRYVNTASTAGGDGTTNGTAGASRAFATLLEAINSLPATLTDAYTIYCEGTAADTSAVNQTPWDMVSSAANYIHIIGEQSPNHPNFSTATSGIYSTSKYRITVTNSNGVYGNTTAHVRIEGIQLQVTVNNGSSFVGFKTTNASQTASDGDMRISHCIVKGVVTSGALTGFNARPVASGSTTSKMWNCLAYDCTNGVASDKQDAEFYNFTVRDSQFGFVEEDTPTIKVVNCLASNCSIGFVGTFTGSSNYNAEDDGNGAPGANSRSGVTFTFVNAGSDDFHLASGDAGAKNFGTSDPGSGLFSDDIDGGTRSATWDIGADEEGVVKTATGERFLATRF